MVNRPGTYFLMRVKHYQTSLIEQAVTKIMLMYMERLYLGKMRRKREIICSIKYADAHNYIVSSIGKPNNINNSALDLLAEELRAYNLSGRVVADFYLENIESDPSKDIARAPR